MKKTFGWLLLCCTLIALTTACGEKKPSSPKPAPGGE